MADPAFASMEEEAETFIPPTASTTSTPTRQTKLSFEQTAFPSPDHEETNPLLAPPILADHPEKKWYNTPSVYWLLPAFLLTALSFGSTMAPKINLYSSLACSDYYSEQSHLGIPGPLPGGAYPVIEIGQQNPDCHLPEIQARAAKLALAVNLCTGMISAITTGKYGALSDRRGRRLVILIALCGTMLNDIIIILMAKYWRVLGLEFFLVGAVLDGVFGSFTTTAAATNAYVADCTNPEKRAISFAYIQSVFFLGIAIGPVIGGVLITRTGSVVTLFYCALAVHISFAFFILFLIPESVTPEHMEVARRKSQIRRMSADGVVYHRRQWQYWAMFLNIFQPLEVFWPRGRGRTFRRKRQNLVILAIVDGILLLNIGAYAVILLYPIYMFNWGDLESGYYLSIVGSARVFILVVVLPNVVRLFRGPNARTTHIGADNLEVWLIRLCPLIEMIGFLCMSTAKTTGQYYAAGALTALGGMGPPTLQSALTKHVDKEEVGRLLGALSLLGSLSRVISPTVLNLLYSFTVGTVPQTIFYVLAGAMFTAFSLSWGVRAHVRIDQDDFPPEGHEEHEAT